MLFLLREKMWQRIMMGVIGDWMGATGLLELRPISLLICEAQTQRTQQSAHSTEEVFTINGTWTAAIG
jgi:hypothetical protein